MAKVRFRVESIPPGELTHLISVTANGSLEMFLVHVIDFGFVMAEALLRGAKMAQGNNMRGYYATDIRLTKKLPRTSNLGAHYVCEIPDLPTYAKLERIAEYLRFESPEDVIPLLIHWFSVASYVAWMHLSLYIMDHQQEDWSEFRFKPLWDARDKLQY